MANDIKVEFETYVKELAETICKEIYLKDLEKVCNAYMEQLDACEKMYAEQADVEKKVLVSTNDNTEKLEDIKKDVEQSLEEIRIGLERFQKEYDSVIQGYSKTVNEVNEELREEFFKKFSVAVADVQEELSKELTGCNASLKDTLKDTITKENLDAYVKQLEENTARITECLGITTEGYKEIFANYKDEIAEVNKEEREQFRAAAEKYIEDGVKVLLERVAASEEAQKKAIAEKLPDKSVIDDMGKQVADMCAKMESMQKAYDEKVDELLEMVKRNEQRSLAQRKYRKKLFGANTVLVAMFVALFIAMNPSGVVGMASAAILGVMLVVYLVLWITANGAIKDENAEGEQ